MRTFITTVAGQSSRFNQCGGNSVLKCLYHTPETRECILYRLLRQATGAGFEHLVVVGGYRYQDLKDAVAHYTARNGQSNVELIYNSHWYDSGSMYSLYYGVQAAAGSGEILFCEGDIIIDDRSFQQICSAQNSAFAVSLAMIHADRSVVGYQGPDDRIHYLYDVQHSLLTFPTSVKAIFHSAQAWKIADTKLFHHLNSNLTESELCGTNLVLIEKYFSQFPMEMISPIIFQYWINCNTREDFTCFEQQKKLFNNV